MREILLFRLFGPTCCYSSDFKHYDVPITSKNGHSLKKKKKKRGRDLRREVERHVKLEYTEVNIK